jgi:tRNA (pseudouridine54-N1)-methyltransferase
VRRFVLIGQKASTSPDFSLDDIPGTTGRLDVLLRCMRSALLVSHGLRRDTLVYLVLYGSLVDSVGPRTIRIDGRVASYLRPDERTMAGRIRAMLGTKAEGDGFAAERQGMAVADGGIDVVLNDLGAATPYVLEEEGTDIRSEGLEIESPVFFVGDHLGFDPAIRERLQLLGARPVSVGPLSLHADDAVALMQNELDRRATRAAPQAR